MTRETYKQLARIALPLCAIAILLGLHFWRLSPDGLWVETFLNSVHVAVFSIVTLLIYAGLSLTPALTTRHRLLVTAAVCLALGAASEAAQISGPRDASFADLALDYLGVAATLLFIAALKSTMRRSMRLVFSGTGIVLFAVALLPLISVSAAYAWRYSSFPVLVSFDSSFVHTFIRLQHADILIRQTEVKNVAVISLRDGPWPGLIVHDLWPDWTGFGTLAIEISVPGSEPLETNIRVHDRLHRNSEQLYSDRFNTTFSLAPGNHTIRVSLEEIRNAPARRAMDLSQIDGLVIFCKRKEKGHAFEIREIRLE